MKFIKYQYKDTGKPGWKFSDVEFSNINLMVGDTASGKTRFLNTIFNLGEFVKGSFRSGSWKLTFEHKKTIYTWEIDSEPFRDYSSKAGRIKKENLWKHDGDRLTPLIERNTEKFIFDKAEMPGRLSQSETALGLLKEDPKIKPIFEAFSTIKRRSFSLDALNKINEVLSISPKDILPKSTPEKNSLKQIFEMDLGVNSTMYFVKRHSYKTFNKIVKTYKTFFPFIENVKMGEFSDLHYDIQLPGKAPVILMQEAGRDEWIHFAELSSGMQKAFLIIMDIYLMPEGGVYMIDEYENSLGVSAIDFFPEFVLELEKEAQFFLTSHHPYLINKIPIKNWYVFHREGLDVTVKFGDELVERYGKSKQEAFLKLLNDPFYTRMQT